MSVTPADPQFVSFTDEPFDSIAEMALGWDMEYDQLQAGANPCDLTQLCLAGVNVAREHVRRTVVVHGMPPAQSIAFGLMAEAGEGTVFHGRRADADTLLYQPSTLDLDLQFRGALFSLVVDAEALRRRMGRSELDATLRHDRVLLTAWQARLLRGLTQESLATFEARPDLLASPAATGALGDQILTLIVHVLEGSPKEAPRAAKPGPRPQRLAAAKNAEAFILANLDRRLAIDDLLQTTTVKERALRLGFIELFGHGPQTHVSSLRLNAVRRALRTAAPGTRVTDVATRYGFWHLGRFAQAYGHLFGELPSATLGRSRANHADRG